MTLRTWSFYAAATGRFAGKHYTGPVAMLEANTPAGFVAIPGRFDRFAQRVDVESGEVVADTSLAAGRDALEARARVLAAIADLERRQARPVRELAIDPSNQNAARRLAAIEAEIAAARALLRT